MSDRLVCEIPPQWGARKGQSVRGTATGRDRHRTANEPPCPECREADNARRKAAYAADRETELAKRRSHYQATSDSYKARAAAWYLINKEHQPLYVTWQGIKQRCLNPKAHNYVRYGGRGVRMFDGWLVWEQFLADIEDLIGPRPPDPMGWKSTRPYYSLDRIDNDGHYEPGNIRWATWKQQAANRRRPA